MRGFDPEMFDSSDPGAWYRPYGNDGGAARADDDDDDLNEVDLDELDEEDVGRVCPNCQGMDYYLVSMDAAQCWEDIRDPGEKGVTITVRRYECNICHHRWEIHEGRPLNTECDCD